MILSILRLGTSHGLQCILSLLTGNVWAVLHSMKFHAAMDVKKRIVRAQTASLSGVGQIGSLLPSLGQKMGGFRLALWRHAE